MCNSHEKALLLSIQSAFKYSNDVDKHAVIDVGVVLNILNEEHNTMFLYSCFMLGLRLMQTKNINFLESF